MTVSFVWTGASGEPSGTRAGKGHLTSVYAQVYTLLMKKAKKVRVESALTIMHSLEQRTKGLLSVRVDPDDRERLLAIIGDQVTVTAFLRTQIRAFLRHHKAGDGENDTYLSILKQPEPEKKITDTTPYLSRAGTPFTKRERMERAMRGQ